MLPKQLAAAINGMVVSYLNLPDSVVLCKYHKQTNCCVISTFPSSYLTAQPGNKYLNTPNLLLRSIQAVFKGSGGSGLKDLLTIVPCWSWTVFSPPPSSTISAIVMYKLYTLKFSRQRRKRKFCVCDGKRGSVWFPSPCLSESGMINTLWCLPASHSRKKNSFSVKSKWTSHFLHAPSSGAEVTCFIDKQLVWIFLSELLIYQSLLPHTLVLLWITPGLHVHAGLSLKARPLHVNTSTRKCCSQRKKSRWAVSLLLSGTQQN